ncbi:MAG: hypothetical protein Q8N56_02125, partial [bacterium]|nr:hypothetical protein [bacterium]
MNNGKIATRTLMKKVVSECSLIYNKGGKEVTAPDKITTYVCKPILFNLLLTKNFEEKKQMKKQLFVLVAVIVAASMALAASGTPT